MFYPHSERTHPLQASSSKNVEAEKAKKAETKKAEKTKAVAEAEAKLAKKAKQGEKAKAGEVLPAVVGCKRTGCARACWKVLTNGLRSARWLPWHHRPAHCLRCASTPNTVLLEGYLVRS